MRIKRILQKMMVRQKSRKDRMPKVTEPEKDVIDIFLNFLRKKDSVLLKDGMSKKVIIQHRDTLIWLNNGLLVIDTPTNINSVLVAEIINNYLLKEFNRIQHKKLYRAEVDVINHLNNNIKNILNQIKNEKTDTIVPSPNLGRQLLTERLPA